MDIKIKSNADENEVLVAVKSKICEICHQNTSKYTCPKCNVPYCTYECYSNPNKHSNCSERFYHDQVVDELKSFKIDDKKKLLDILKRVQNDDINDDEDLILEKFDNKRKSTQKQFKARSISGLISVD